jgi:arylsulfatase A-like enzyme
LKKKQPNILFINTDQQNLTAISAHGNPYVQTPNIDRLIERGTSFQLSHSAHPVCGPARACWYTGRPSSELGLPSNAYALRHEFPNLRNWVQDYGYNELYVGKYGVFYEKFPNHYPIAGHWLGEYSDDGISRAAQAFFKNYADSKPFFLSLGIHQPHDICFFLMATSRTTSASS